MILLEFLGKLFIDILFEGIILGFFRLLGKGFSKLRVLISGREKPIDPIKVLEQKYCYKKIELTVNLNERLKSGQHGAVLEIIDTNKVFAEFYDANGELIECNDELAFEIEFNQFKLKG